jgi:ABC-type branched-subunit amino acid transport system substrate-binding protein/outer membrane protein assembly factor BamD (BamD/ComL family)
MIRDLTRRFRSASLPLCLFLVAACAPGQFAGPPQPADPARALFDQAEQFYDARYFRRALPVYQEYLETYPDGKSVPDALLRVGDILRARGDAAAAMAAHRKVLAEHGGHDRAPDALLALLRMHYFQGDYQGVLRTAETYLNRVGEGPHRSAIYGVLGDTYRRGGSPVNAAYFYARAMEGTPAPGEDSVERLRTVARDLSAGQLLSLLERVRSPEARGYLTYEVALREVAEERYEDALRTLSQFEIAFPGHPFRSQAEALRREVAGYYEEAGVGGPAVGVLLPLSGAYQVYGNKALRSIEFALARSGRGDRVRLVVEDSGSDPATAVAAVEALSRENVIGVIGPIIAAEEAARTAQDFGLPIITLSQKIGITETGDYVFRHFLTPAMQVRSLAEHAVRKLGIDQFAVLYPDEKYGVTFMNLFWTEVTAFGGNVIAVEPYDTGLTDFGGPIRNIARNRGVQAVFIPDAPQKAGLIVPQLAYYEMGGAQLLGTNLWHSDKLVRMAGRFVQGAICPDVFYAGSAAPGVAEFVREFEGAMGEPPNFIDALAYDTGRLVLKLAANPAVETRNAFRDALYRMQPHRGVTGTTAFDETGEAVKSLFLLRVEGDGFVEVAHP